MKIKRVTSKIEFQDALCVRHEVFVKEQGFTMEEEIDKNDFTPNAAEYFVLYNDEKPIATARLRFLDKETAKAERLCVLKSYRKSDCGKKIMNALESFALEQGIKELKLHGQVQAAGFYLKNNYEKMSDDFLEDGVLHCLFVKKL